MKLWVDDMRRPPSGEWVWARNAQQAMDDIETCILRGSRFEEVHLDHDLGMGASGYDVVVWIKESGNWPERVELHTDNPVGRDNMRFVIENAGVYTSRTRAGGYADRDESPKPPRKRGWKKGR